MSGIAIVINDADFSSNNLGQVTILEDIDVTGVSITGDSAPVGMTSQYSVTYTPVNTSQTGVTWSIESGDSYATIDQNGLLTILEGASGNQVIIKAVSIYNNEVYAMKTLSVTFNEDVPITAISITGDSTVEATSAQYTAVLTPSNTTEDVTWSITSGSTYASVDQNGLLTVLSSASSSTVTIRASNQSGTIYAEKTVTVSYPAVSVMGGDFTGGTSLNRPGYWIAHDYPSGNHTLVRVTFNGITTPSDYAGTTVQLVKLRKNYTDDAVTSATVLASYDITFDGINNYIDVNNLAFSDDEIWAVKTYSYVHYITSSGTLTQRCGVLTSNTVGTELPYSTNFTYLELDVQYTYL